jgi:hypothetical protein
MSTAEGSLVIRVGALDGKEALEEGKPSAEIYTCGRAGWVGEVAGAEQLEKFF